jgi:membrane protease YdiL (CAAX protease family)
MQRAPQTDILIWLSVYALAKIVGEMVALLFLGIEQAHEILSLEVLDNHLRVNLMFAQAFSHVVSYTLPAIFIIFIVDQNQNLSTQTYSPIRMVFLAFAMLLCLGLFYPTLELIIFLSKQIPLPESLSKFDQNAEKMTNFILNFQSPYEFGLGVLVLAVLPALGEELLFRAVLQNKLLRLFSNPHTAILLGAAVFSFLHFQFEGFLPRWILGAIFGYFYYFSKNLIFPILLHFFNNAVTVSAAYFYQKNITELQNQKSHFSFYDCLWVALTLFMALAIAYLLEKKIKHEQS